MNRTILALVLGGSFFAPVLAHADDPEIPERRPSQIFVHLNDGVLHGHALDGFQVTCPSPCNREVPAAVEYTVLSSSAASAPFTLHRDARRVDIAFSAGAPMHTAGLALTVVGSIATVVGASVFMYGAMDHERFGAA